MNTDGPLRGLGIRTSSFRRVSSDVFILPPPPEHSRSRLRRAWDTMVGMVLQDRLTRIRSLSAEDRRSSDRVRSISPWG